MRWSFDVLAFWASTILLFLSSLEIARGDTGEGHSAALFRVHVNLDVEAMVSAHGVTIIFDKKDHSMRMDPGIAMEDGLAWGRFDDNIDKTGWSELYVDTTTSQQVANDAKMYAAGYVEGLLTCVRISQYYANTHKLLLRSEGNFHSLMAVKKMMENEVVFMKAKSNFEEHVMTEEPADPYFKHVRYTMFQLWGVLDGYNFAAKHFNVHTLSLTDMILLNSGAELPELMQAYTPLAVTGRANAQSFVQSGGQPIGFLQRGRSKRRAPKEDPLDDAHWEKRVAQSGRCSAFVRVNEDKSDLLVGHTTWDDYSEMTRIFKYYNFNLHGAETMTSMIAFSSYPGAVSSMDDFYVMDSGLVVTETSIELLDLFAWDKVQDFPAAPHVPNFAHVMATNRLAKTGAHWARIHETLNTGTMNAQWMIVDYNQFKPGHIISDNTLWVVESIPGATHKEDLSHQLRGIGYWASFNRPYFDTIREASGHAAAQKSHGSLYSFTDNPRATIFRKAAPGIQSLHDMRVLMDRNLYPYAGVEPNEPGHEISARMDLSPTQPIPNGGIDAKITNRCLMKMQQVQAISGPSHAALPAFRWMKDDGTETWPGWPHEGLPRVWNFDYVQMTSQGQGAVTDIAEC